MSQSSPTSHFQSGSNNHTEENVPVEDTAPLLLSNSSKSPPVSSGWYDYETTEAYYYMSMFFVGKWLVTRGLMLILILRNNTLSGATSLFFVLEIGLIYHYYNRKSYFPGSAYNDLHVITYRRRLYTVYHSDSFSPVFRFVWTLWGYFILTSVIVSVKILSSPEWTFQYIIALVIVLSNLRALIFYSVITLVWYIQLTWVLSTIFIRAVLCIIFQGHSWLLPWIILPITQQDNPLQYQFYKYLYEHME